VKPFFTAEAPRTQSFILFIQSGDDDWIKPPAPYEYNFYLEEVESF
jgi:hypothetical protein